jgi:3-dehydroquinate synthase
MKGFQIAVRHRSTSSSYLIDIAGPRLDQIADWAFDRLGGHPRKAALISNPTVFDLYGERLVSNLKSAGIEASVWLMKDGERYKDLGSLKGALKHLSEQQLSRDDVVIALGGGVVGDLAGFAASIYLRGIRSLQVPTTFLAMIDSSVGGKTGINSEFGKNLIGTFHRPSGVLIDPSVLSTLPRRELTAGYCEAIKHGALSGAKLLKATSDHLAGGHSAVDSIEGFEKLIHDQVSFKASIVRQDETEETGRTDAGSRKILNFGHTFGHALERVTNYRRLRHGEAVGYGVLVAAELSKNLDLLPRDELNLLYDVVHRAGALPRISDIEPVEIFKAFKLDKKMSAGNLQWILLNGIGKPVIVPENVIPRSALTRAVKAILKA